MSDNYNNVLNKCLAASCVGLTAAALLPLPPLVPFLIGVAPLIYYHVLYLRPRARHGLSQSAIDSVYYYGFLVTITALGATALQLAMRGISGDFTSVAFQFGLGLLATGYAVFARIDLTAASRLVEEASPEEVLDRYIQRSRELVTNVELASSSYRSFAETTLEHTSAFATRVQSEVQTAISDAMESFRREVAAAGDEARYGLTDLRAMIADVTFGAERDELRKSVRSILTTMTKLNVAIEQLIVGTAAGTAGAQSLSTALASLRDDAAGATASIARLGAPDGGVVRFVDAVEAGAAGLDGAVSALGGAATSLREIVGRLSETTADVAAMDGLSSEVRVRLADLAEALQPFERLGETAATASAALHSLATSSEAGARTVGAVGSGVSALETAVTEAAPRLRSGIGSLLDVVDGLGEAVERTTALSGSIGRSAESAEEGASERRRHREAVEDLRRAIDGMRIELGQRGADILVGLDRLERSSFGRSAANDGMTVPGGVVDEAAV